MASPIFIFLLLIIRFSSISNQASAFQYEIKTTERRSVGVGQRLLLSFKETPHGSNSTFECSPSGPCVPCQYSEKNDEKYRCSETGYRIPLKCVESEDLSKIENEKKTQTRRAAFEISNDSVKPHVVLHDMDRLITSVNHRSLLDDSSTSKGKSQAYITYRSCIPAVNEEKLSVLGFEGIVLCLLVISGSAVYFRRKRALTTSGVGAGRSSANSRF
ncbi:Mediator of DNA damage checkpoint protein 1 [Melia azedarach]|uniref:Mediator of DNA damage checkpoint protein 1 n=1 Tax=Melia azedarach TaxID=155640 RepID=A0ACC1XKF0_MELAZ|nr:Mediator of DNA damage checkpoint protein 1 [Melia azedarach]